MAASHGGIKRGSFNIAVGFLGVPGTGKSTSALAYARQYEGRAYIVAHDPTYSYQGPDVTRHETLAELSSSLRSKPGGIHALDLDEGSQVVEAGIQLARQSLASGNNTPVLLLVDEAVACDEMGAYRIGTSFRRLITNRRHLHIGIVWTSQNPGYVHHTILAQMTQLVIFRLQDGRSLKRLEQAGIPAKWLLQVPKLQQYKYLVWDFQHPPQDTPSESKSDLDQVPDPAAEETADRPSLDPDDRADEVPSSQAVSRSRRSASTRLSTPEFPTKPSVH